MWMIWLVLRGGIGIGVPFSGLVCVEGGTGVYILQSDCDVEKTWQLMNYDLGWAWSYWIC